MAFNSSVLDLCPVLAMSDRRVRRGVRHLAEPGAGIGPRYPFGPEFFDPDRVSVLPRRLI
jgi:hypothetical protein